MTVVLLASGAAAVGSPVPGRAFWGTLLGAAVLVGLPGGVVAVVHLRARRRARPDR